MTGNDLVDLKAAAIESNWKRKGFLDKLFHPEEQTLIYNAPKPDEMVWMLWSMKESSYKIHNRLNGIREYAPLKFHCKHIDNIGTHYLGEVHVQETKFYTKTEVEAGEYLHTIAAHHKNALQAIETKLYLHRPEINYKAMAPACVSHHGRYLALIF